jgi:hypothetical protein
MKNKKFLTEEINKMLHLMNHKLGTPRLNEDDKSEYIAAGSEIEQALQKPIGGFVDDFSRIASDPKVQAVLKGGLTIDGDKTDDRNVQIGDKGWTPVKNLKPTQNEIGAAESLKNILTDKYGSLSSFLDGKADVGSNPVVIYNGEYIIDGHHRWSQVFAANPDAEIPTLNLVGKYKPQDILKIVHLAVAAGANGLPLAKAKGVNLLEASKDNVVKMVFQSLNDKAAKIWNEKRNTKCENSQCYDLAELIWGNVQKLQANGVTPGAPPRTKMPQTDAAEPTSKVISRLDKGIINYDDPSEVKNTGDEEGV